VASNIIFPGRILWVCLRRGQRKKRPAVAISTPDSDGDLFVIGCTTNCTGDTNTEIELPWKADRHPLTKLKKPTVAVLNWIERLSTNDIREIGGRLPPSKWLELEQRIRSTRPHLREQK
jgi:mRNA-degrading endonuclease toxin of MazEF toxin-antitoxin module